MASGAVKTALTDWLTEQGITVVDADLAARVVVAPGQPALAEIIAAFGDEYLLPDGQLNPCGTAQNWCLKMQTSARRWRR